MIKAAVILSLMAVCSAGLLGLSSNDYGRGSSSGGGYGQGSLDLSSGRSSYGNNDDYSQPIPYAFGYDVKDEHGLQLTREEKGDGGNSVRGSYSYRDGAGIQRIVEYVADKNGFRAVVKTNEPGTAKSNPADVEMLADPVPNPDNYNRNNNNGKW